MLTLALVALALMVLAPVASALPKIDIDCYTWTLEVCSNGSCTTQECDQCDYYVGGVYVGSTGGCGS